MNGQAVTVSKPYGDASRATTTSYDAYMRPKTVTDSLGYVTTYGYANSKESSGQRNKFQTTMRIVNPDGGIHTSYQDRFGRVVREVEQSPTKSRTITYAYTPQGKVVQQQVSSQGITQTTRYGYDGWGNLIYVKDNLGQTYQYVYNRFGQNIAVYINGELQKSRGYNEVGWLMNKTDPEGKQETYAYYETGLLKTYTDKAGQTFAYTYTPYHEPERTVLTGGTYWQENQYDPQTRQLLQSANSEGETTTYRYDKWKRLEEQKVAGRSYRFGYDSQDRLERIMFPDGLQQTFTYDSLNRLQNVSYPSMGTITYEYGLGDNQHTYTVHFPGNRTMERQTDAFGEWVEVRHTQQDTTRWAETFSYDGMGNIQSIERNGESFAYAYDGLNRIRQENTPIKGNYYYTYDERGNRKVMDRDNPPAVEEGTFDYTYTPLNQLKTYTDNVQINASYTYYSDGLRATKTVNGTTTRYVYVNGRVIEELDENGNSKARNIWGNELLYRQDQTSGLEGYYFYNGHGDVVSITDASGNETNRYDYDIWGNILSRRESISNPFKYAGEIYDEETGLYYLRARYYDPSVGRFITKDTYEGDITNPLSLNLYTYVHNSPLRYVDPSGHLIKELFQGVVNFFKGDKRFSEENVKYFDENVWDRESQTPHDTQFIGWYQEGVCQ